MATLNNPSKKPITLETVESLQAYLECSSEVQAGIRELLQIVQSPDTDDDDRTMTLLTLHDALFPGSHDGRLGTDLEESELLDAKQSEEMRAVVETMDREEETFADRLRALMKKHDITQEQLAGKTGVGQPAISNMLNRCCRPQNKTVERLAEALRVAPEELWPTGK